MERRNIKKSKAKTKNNEKRKKKQKTCCKTGKKVEPLGGILCFLSRTSEYRLQMCQVGEKFGKYTVCKKKNLMIDDSHSHLKEIGKHGRFVVEQDVGVTQRWAEWFVNWSRTKLGGTIVWNRVEQGGTLSKLAGTSAGASWNFWKT